MRPTFSFGLTLALVTLCALALPRRARACSCVGPHPERHVVPSDGAVDFPTGGTVRVFLSGFPRSVRPLVGAEYRLQDAQGKTVPAGMAIVGARVDLQPRAPLAPHATYAVEQVFAFDAAGTRLTDIQRLRARYQPPLRGGWYRVATFTTAAATPAHRTVAPTLKDARLQVLHGGGDCGPATIVTSGVAFGPTLPTDIVELDLQSHGPVTSSLASQTSDLYAGDALCDPDPITLPAGPIVLRAVVRDASNAIVGASPWVRAPEDGPRPASGTHDGFFASSVWPSVTIVPPVATPAHGPADCVNGLQVVARYDAVGEGAPWMYADRALLDGSAGARWSVFGGAHDGDPMQVVAVGDGGTIRRLPPTLKGYPVTMVSTTRGPLLSFDTYSSDNHSHGHLVQLDTQGSSVWSRDVADDMRHRAMAVGGGDVLIAWAAQAAPVSGQLAIALFRAQDGAPGPSVVSTYGVETNSEEPAVAWVDGHFLVVWESGAGFHAGPLLSAVASASGVGPTNDLSAVGVHSPPDLVAAGTRAGLATGTADGRVLFTLLDRDGRLAAAPVDVGAGLGGNRLPRVAWNGRDFAVAWETYPSPGVYVAVVDASRNASQAVRVDADEPLAGTVGIVPTPMGWMASYTTDRGHGRIAELRCAARPLGGPPPSIGP